MRESVFDRTLVRVKMKEMNVSQADMARLLNLPSQSAMSNILKGIRRVTVDEAAQIYQFLGLDVRETSQQSIHNVPIIGFAAAGNWREAVELAIGKMSIPPNVAGPRSFAVQVVGDSMDKLFAEDSYLVIDPDQKELRADKCYMLQNGDHEVTVKCYKRNPARFVPVSSNPDHKEFLVSEHDIVIVGRAVWTGGPL